MAYGRRIKTEMRGDTSRYGHREYVKHAANRLRRRADRLEVTERSIGTQSSANADHTGLVTSRRMTKP
jgi:hypothetical protein